MTCGESLRARLYRWTLARSLRWAEKRVFHGVRVAILWPDDEERQVIFPKIEEALALLRQYDPRRLRRFQNDVSAILAQRTSGARGEWLSVARLVRLQRQYVEASETTALAVASTLIHEGAHAWLDRLGFDYAEAQRARIEAVCFRSQLAFLRRVPGSEDLIEATGRQLTREPEYWTDRAMSAREDDYLKELGVPGWLVRVLARVRERAPSNNRLQRSECSRSSHTAAEPDR